MAAPPLSPCFLNEAHNLAHRHTTYHFWQNVRVCPRCLLGFVLMANVQMPIQYTYDLAIPQGSI